LVESKLNAIVYIEIKGGGAESSIKLKRVKKAILQAKRLESSTFRVGLSIHSIYSTHPLIWEQMLNFAFAEQLPVCIHAAESPAEHAFALCGSGTLKTEYLSRYEDLHIPTPYLSPIRYLEKLGALEFKPLLIHCVEVDENDIKLISRSGCSVVHCPRSNALLNCNLMPLHSFFAAQVPVFLGTDSLASSPNLNVLEEAAVAISSHKNKVNGEAIMSLTSKSIFSVV
ncbi:MAG: amidohydrolase family protein, partial [Candidatus Promineifilaceae bacterium]